MLTIHDAVLYLDIIWKHSDLARKLPNVALLREEMAKVNVHLDQDELQQGVDGLRRHYVLFDVEATRLWMKERGIGLAQLELLAQDNIVYQKLRRRIAGEQAALYFDAHVDELADLTIVCGTAASEAECLRLSKLAREARGGAFEGVASEILASARANKLLRCEIRVVRRRDLKALGFNTPRSIESGVSKPQQTLYE